VGPGGEGEAEYISLPRLRETGRLIAEVPEATLLDLGDGVACLEFHTKMNTFDRALTAFVNTARAIAERDFAALVIGNQGRHFSAGYNVKLFLETIAAQDWSRMDALLREVQAAFLGLKYAQIPVVAAPFGYTLGAGCECAIHCHAAQASAELYMGLPETSIGLLPAGGGTKEMLARAMADWDGESDPFPRVERVFEGIVTQENSSSAHEARKMGFLRPTDGISINSDRLIYDAKQRALELANAGHVPPVKRSIWVLGEEGLARLRMSIHGRYRSGAFSDHDRLIADKVATVLSGGLSFPQEVSEDYLLQREREAFLELAREPKSPERMRYTLETGKPLKN
jgi:3-hydroxyacyl-CoA dehydrogenase